MIDSVDLLVNGLANRSQQFMVNKASIANQLSGAYTSLWRATGVPAQGAIPTTASILDNTTVGGFTYNNASGLEENYIGRAFLLSSNSGTDVQFVDRLAHMGGLSGTVTTSQTVNLDVSGSGSNLVERRGDANYSDVQWWLEWYTDTGATVVNVTVTYTNASGTSGRTVVLPTLATMRASRMIAIVGNGGEFIQSIQSIQLSATTGTAGNFGITATKILTTASLGLANAGQIFDWAILGLPKVASSSCVTLLILPGTTSSGTLVGSAKLITG